MLPNVEDIAALVRALDEARAEVERLRFDLQGIILERDQLLDIQKEKEKEVERLRAVLQEIARGKAGSDYDDLRLTATRVCGIARRALAAAQPEEKP